jgi:hypothetical protein
VSVPVLLPVKDLLAVHDLPFLKDLADSFFEDEWANRRGLDIGIFFKEVNRLIGLRNESDDLPDLTGTGQRKAEDPYGDFEVDGTGKTLAELRKLGLKQ